MNKLHDYKLFLDDERFPAGDLEGWVIARNFWKFKEIINARGIPKFVTFDHDLGDDTYTGKKCAEYLILQMECLELPPSEIAKFRFDVHSQNPIGAKNIRLYLEAWLDELSKE